ncbi:S1 RNA-binding domain-containing protein [Spiroplasma endosymbiont of Danaus chrysippus]|uniref:S1 RNA-binding domain-containing protein n=1 Tax=Spiroplasma endosymbiont of Danaus chrysippus TaxID=2691041 RepID=UPI00157A3EC1|nr:S1 RNA-binding domain-containing protein [Spiroplasma endosymbiont of Danaus chrysippus]
MEQAQFKIGDIIEATINNIVSFGVFCKCPNHYTGLIHISNISNSFVNNVEDYFSNGETIKVEIISIDNDNKKLSLSTKNFNIIAKNKENKKND